MKIISKKYYETEYERIMSAPLSTTEKSVAVTRLAKAFKETKEDVKKVLKEEAKIIGIIREDGMTPDEFTEDEYVDMIIEDLE